MRRRISYTAFTVEGTGETDDAFECDLQGFDTVHRKIWIPKSCIAIQSLGTIEDATEGDEIEIYIADWWVKNKGIE